MPNAAVDEELVLLLGRTHKALPAGLHMALNQVG